MLHIYISSKQSKVFSAWFWKVCYQDMDEEPSQNFKDFDEVLHHFGGWGKYQGEDKFKFELARVVIFLLIEQKRGFFCWTKPKCRALANVVPFH
jgi:hypothetical protein